MSQQCLGVGRGEGGDVLRHYYSSAPGRPTGSMPGTGTGVRSGTLGTTVDLTQTKRIREKRSPQGSGRSIRTMRTDGGGGKGLNGYREG